MSGHLQLKVAPEAARNAITGWMGDTLKLSVTAAPEKGKANEAVIDLLAKALDVPRSSIAVVRGQTSQQKLVAVQGFDDAQLRRRLEDLARS